MGTTYMWLPVVALITPHAQYLRVQILIRGVLTPGGDGRLVRPAAAREDCQSNGEGERFTKDIQEDHRGHTLHPLRHLRESYVRSRQRPTRARRRKGSA